MFEKKVKFREFAKNDFGVQETNVLKLRVSLRVKQRVFLNEFKPLIALDISNTKGTAMI